MRYFIQFLIPALIVIAVVYTATRRRRQAVAETGNSDTGTFILIVVVGSLVALGVTFTVGSYLDF